MILLIAVSSVIQINLEAELALILATLEGLYPAQLIATLILYNVPPRVAETNVFQIVLPVLNVDLMDAGEFVEPVSPDLHADRIICATILLAHLPLQPAPHRVTNVELFMNQIAGAR